MFNEFVILHTPNTIPEPQNDKNALSVEKMTQTGEGIWQVSRIFPINLEGFGYKRFLRKLYEKVRQTVTFETREFHVEVELFKIPV